jgi:hypothetical protein
MPPPDSFGPVFTGWDIGMGEPPQWVESDLK